MFMAKVNTVLRDRGRWGRFGETNPPSMRTSFTLFGALALLSLHAQVTITYADLDPNGVVSDMFVITDPGTAVPPTAGANQTWDLSSITLQNIGTLAFGSAVGTPYAATYPTANWVWGQTLTGVGTNYYYLLINTSAIEVVARDVPSSPVNYSDPSRVMQFPWAYNTSFTDPYVANGNPSTVTWTYTGHGTLILPNETYTDVVMTQSDEGDRLLWNTSPLYPIIIDDGSTQYVFTQNNVGITEAARTGPNAWPNPCTDQLMVSEVSAGSQWRVVDAQGRLVEEGRASVGGPLTIGVRSLEAGSYILLLNDAGTMRRTTFVKQ